LDDEDDSANPPPPRKIGLYTYVLTWQWQLTSALAVGLRLPLYTLSPSLLLCACDSLYICFSGLLWCVCRLSRSRAVVAAVASSS